MIIARREGQVIGHPKVKYQVDTALSHSLQSFPLNIFLQKNPPFPLPIILFVKGEWFILKWWKELPNCQTLHIITG